MWENERLGAKKARVTQTRVIFSLYSTQSEDGFDQNRHMANLICDDNLLFSAEISLLDTNLETSIISLHYLFECEYRWASFQNTL